MSVGGLILAIIVFSLIVLFHELGHFLAAKACNVKVNEFCLGLGPTIFSFGKGETKYSLKALPFGGACMMEGEDELTEAESSDEAGDNVEKKSSDGRAFFDKKCWQRILIVAMGPIFNFIMAYIFSVIIICCMGVDKPVVTEIMPGYAAEAAGLSAGDEIIALNNYRVHFYSEISLYNAVHTGEVINVTYKRNGQKLNAVLEPKFDEETGRYLIGLIRDADREKVNFFEALVYGGYEVKYQIYATVKSLGMLISGAVGADQVTGAVGIVSTIDDIYQESVESGVFYIFINMLNISVLLSANLGFMNLLPIPALDGGRLIFLFVELIIRRRVPAKYESRIHLAGFVFLIGLMIVVMFNDIYKLFISL